MRTKLGRRGDSGSIATQLAPSTTTSLKMSPKGKESKLWESCHGYARIKFFAHDTLAGGTIRVTDHM